MKCSCRAVLVSIVAFGLTPGQPCPTEVPMRRIGLVAIEGQAAKVARIGYLSPNPAANAHLQEP